MSIGSIKVPFVFEKIYTQDGYGLDGIISSPQRSRSVVLFLHGLGSSFYGSIPRNEALANACVKHGFAFASFNTRGHDMVSSFRKRIGKEKSRYAYVSGGMSFERFEDCQMDIDAMIKSLRMAGFNSIYLAGHSTGANKALYYLYKTRDRAVKGLCLIAPMSDLAIERHKLGKKFNGIVDKVRKIARNDPDGLLPANISVRLMTARRYLSLHTEGSSEDVFPYAYAGKKFKELKSVSIPVAVVIGDDDAYLDRNPQEFIRIFEKNAMKARLFHGYIIKGGQHSFFGREKQLADAVVTWVHMINKPLLRKKRRKNVH